MSDTEKQTANEIKETEEEAISENTKEETEHVNETEKAPEKETENQQSNSEKEDANSGREPKEKEQPKASSEHEEESPTMPEETSTPKKESQTTPAEPARTEDANGKETNTGTGEAKDPGPGANPKTKTGKKKSKKKVRIEIEELNGLIKKIDNQTKKIESLSKQSEEMRTVIEQNKVIIDSYAEEVRIQKGLIDTHEGKIRELGGANEDLRERSQEQTREIQKAKDDRRNLLERNEKLVKLWEEMEVEVKRTKASTVELDCKNYELMEEKKDLLAELEFCRQEARQKTLIEGQIHELQRERLRLSRDNEKFKNSKTIRKLKENEQTIGKLRKQVEVLTKQKNELIAENKKFVGFSLKSQEDLRKNGDEVRRLEKQQEDLETRNKVLEKELQAGRQAKDQRIDTLTLRNIKLEAQNKSLRRNLGEAKRESEDVEARHRDKVSKMQKAMGELRQQNQELKEAARKGGFAGRTSKQDLEAIKREKGIIRDLAQQKNEMERKMIQSASEMKRFKLKYEDALSRLKQKESHLRFICDEFIASSSIPKVGQD